MQDRELIEKIKAGDCQAFKDLFDRYKGLVVNICYRLVGNKEDADDLTQDVFLKVYKSAKHFKHHSKFSTWIYRIAVNLCLNYLRKKGHFHLFSVDKSSNQSNIGTLNTLIAPSEDQPDVFFEQKELEKIIWKMINSLPKNQRVALILHRYEGLSCREIGEILECSIGSVHARLYRAKENLQEKLIPYLKKV